MKFILLPVVVLAAFTSCIKANAEGQDSVFVRTFKNLHREPQSPPSRRSSENVKTLWIEQKLDNFDEAENRTWKMRYLSNDEFYQEGGPLFIVVGGEGEISLYHIFGHFYDMAKEHNAYLFCTEHRYYGQSRPTDDLSIENLKYLNVHQALADLAHFIRTMKSTIPGMSNSKVILVGGSYSATMVTWFKKLYPDLATGVWASSAPLFAKVNFVEYKEVMGESIRLVGGEDCYNRIKNGIAEMEDLFAKKRGAEVKSMLKLCSNFDESSDMNLWTLFYEISEIFAGIVQNHYENTIQKACRSIMAGEDDITGVAKFLLSKNGKMYINGTKACNDLTYEEMMKTMTNVFYTNNYIGMRQWIYQTCNEFGWHQTSDSKAQPFGTKFPLLLFTTMCADAYGDKFSIEFINKQVAATNEIFGGFTPDVENVYSTHGSLDPWNSMGIAKDKATFIPLHGHCMDFGSITERDTPEMLASKERIAALVREWLAVPALNY